MRRLLLLAAAGCLVSCAAKRTELEVKPFVLRDADFGYNDDPMVRSEMMRRLHGAVGVREQEQVLGQYFTVLWSHPAPETPVEVVFEYQQGGTGSLVKRSVRKFEAGVESGKAEFSVVGSNYTKNGRVLAWKVSLMSGGRVLATRKSYLWQ